MLTVVWLGVALMILRLGRASVCLAPGRFVPAAAALLVFLLAASA